MAIILEGPDNSGKSTLAAKISKQFNMPVIHGGGPGTQQDYQQRISESLMYTTQNVVMDRHFCISEPVYAQALGRPALFDPRQYWRILQAMDANMFSNSVVIIFCTAEDEVLLDFSKHEVKAHETAEHVEQMKKNGEAIISHYKDLAFAFYAFTNSITVNPRRDTQKVLNFLHGILK